MQAQPHIKNPSLVVAASPTLRAIKESSILPKIPTWKLVVKRVLDVFFSSLLLILLSPLLILIALITKLMSKGTILYSQERIGMHYTPFTIYKFRSMISNAEKNGPELSSPNDQRISRWGRIMRKWKLDELPQLWNILIGDMSFVGPRPERKFYINQLIQIFPLFPKLLEVKPGLTSLGMIEFGYASTIEEIKIRAERDIHYVTHFSLLLDLKIVYRTLIVVISGKGK